MDSVGIIGWDRVGWGRDELWVRIRGREGKGRERSHTDRERHDRQLMILQ